MPERMRQRQIKYAILVVVGLVPWIYASPIFAFENNGMWNIQPNDAVYELHNGLSSVSRAGVFNRLQESVNSRTRFDEMKDESIHLAEATGFSQDGIKRITSFDPRGTTLSPKCTNSSTYSQRGCWHAAEGRSYCWVWNPDPQPDETVSWDGHCVDGLMSGQGNLIWRFIRDNREMITWQTGSYRDGREQGHFVYKNRFGEIWEGNYESGEPHGLWMMRETGRELELIADCRRQGARIPLESCIQETYTPIARMLKSTVALRYGPGMEFGFTGSFLTSGTHVEVTHTTDEWVWVKSTNGRAGFIPIALLTEVVSDPNVEPWLNNMSEEELKLWILKNLIDLN